MSQISPVSRLAGTMSQEGRCVTVSVFTTHDSCDPPCGRRRRGQTRTAWWMIRPPGSTTLMSASPWAAFSRPETGWLPADLRCSQVSCQSPRLSLGGNRPRLQQAGDDTLYLVGLAAKPDIQLHPSVDLVPFILIELLKLETDQIRILPSKYILDIVTKYLNLN